jgi:hypothetical protein
VSRPRRRREAERGQVTVYAVLLFPTLMLVLALVLAIGMIEAARTQIRSQLDMAALVATQALDPAGLAAGEPPRLSPTTAEALAREYLARNLAGTEILAASPASVAVAADVVVSNEPGTDPITGLANEAPTVSIRVDAPVRIPILGIIGLDQVVTLSIAGSAAART